MNERDQILEWIADNSPTIATIKEKHWAHYIDQLQINPIEFYEEIRDQYNELVKNDICEEISRSTGISSDMILEVYKELYDLYYFDNDFSSTY